MYISTKNGNTFLGCVSWESGPESHICTTFLTMSVFAHFELIKFVQNLIYCSNILHQKWHILNENQIYHETKLSKICPFPILVGTLLYILLEYQIFVKNNRRQINKKGGRKSKFPFSNWELNEVYYHQKLPSHYL